MRGLGGLNEIKAGALVRIKAGGWVHDTAAGISHAASLELLSVLDMVRYCTYISFGLFPTLELRLEHLNQTDIFAPQLVTFERTYVRGDVL